MSFVIELILSILMFISRIKTHARRCVRDMILQVSQFDSYGLS